ncbi:hypothetical protein C8F04DRAFT_1094538 [Mycena alexandri]|uniref:Uncharacterized protein n=1 Tax=Mycena alexandri TaxID=1745969 RepID=A0AAD6T1P6_9AGAR|nr:hypothetical protein C8F04DRAFT_1094538 [Mycena alexandri]
MAPLLPNPVILNLLTLHCARSVGDLPRRKTAGKTARGGKPMVHEDILASGAFPGGRLPLLPQTNVSYESVLNSAEVAAPSFGFGIQKNCMLVSPQERQSQQVSQHPNKSPEPSNRTPRQKKIQQTQRVLTTCPRHKF